MAKLVLLDGHSLAYRAFHALPPEMATTSGELTNATFGFATMLLDVLERERPDFVAVAFDIGRTWRHEQFSDYKGTRLKAPAELPAQVERIKELVRAFNIPIFTAPGWEADDVLGTLAHQAERAGVSVLIVTGDTDAHQLVTGHVHVQSSGRYFRDVKIYDPAAIRDRYELEPHQLVDYKALLGDKSDNIPGVAGIGEKTATTLLQQFGDLEGIYAHLHQIKGRALKPLTEGREMALLSRKLARIDQQVPSVTLELESCRTRDFDRQRVFELFRELQFTSLIERIPAPDAASTVPVGAEAEPLAVHYTLVDSEELLVEVAERLSAASEAAFDCETDGQDAITAALVGLSLSVEPGEAWYIPLGHRALPPAGQLALEPSGEDGRNLPLDSVLEMLNPQLARPDLALYAHNAKFDLEVLLRHGFTIPSVQHDSKIAAWLLNPGSRASGLKALALSELGVPMTDITELIGTGRKQITMAQVPVQAASDYAAADADMTLRLVPLQKAALEQKALAALFHTVEMPLLRVLTDIELHGVFFDPTALTDVRATIQARLAELEGEIYRLAGYDFNIGSTQQLSEVLFEKLALPKTKSSRTKHGSYSTASNVLESLAGDHPIAMLVLEHRSLQKLLSTYVDQLPTMVNRATGRIHTDFSQTAAETGRLSSSNPNLQNIPVRTELGREIRRAFVAPPGHWLLSADYSQVELRVLAHLSGDAAMIASFQRGEDIHAATAVRLFHLAALDDVSKDQRRIAKIINFGLLFGMSAFRLAREASIPYAEAEEALHNYFKLFPQIAAYLDSIVGDVMKQGYAETIMGRRRYFPVLQESPDSNPGRAEERAAKNHPIQGSAAEIIKVAMIRIHEALRARALQTRMVLQVHDELLFEVPEAELAEVVPLILDLMCGAMALAVPLGVDAKVGHNWDQMEPLGEEDFLEPSTLN